MRASSVAASALFLHGCIGGDGGSFSGGESQSHAPAVALGATEGSLDYGSTGGACFRVPGVARGTGYAQKPELALGAVWTREADCPDCAWLPTADVYTGPGSSTDRELVEVFDGVVSFDDTGSGRALADIFGAVVAPGAMAELTATRTWSGIVDYREAAVQAQIGVWREVEAEGDRGLAWNVTRFEWSARFLVPYVEFDPDAEVVEVDGEPYLRTDNSMVGYEVFACLLGF